MNITELTEYPERAAIPHGVGRSADWYSLASWPPTRDGGSRIMLALHRTTGECYIDWAEIERTAGDVTDQARHLARALLAIRDQASARQLAVFMACYLEGAAQTVSGLATKLGISGAAISRALDHLAEFDLVRRKKDTRDRKRILVQRTVMGISFLRDLEKIIDNDEGNVADQVRSKSLPHDCTASDDA